MLHAGLFHIALIFLTAGATLAADATVAATAPILRPFCTGRTAEITYTVAWMPTEEFTSGHGYNLLIAMQNTAAKFIHFTGDHTGSVDIRDAKGNALPVRVKIAPADIGNTATTLLLLGVDTDQIPAFPWHLRYMHDDKYSELTVEVPAQ
jgi:hypothetical protein